MPKKFQDKVVSINHELNEIVYVPPMPSEETTALLNPVPSSVDNADVGKKIREFLSYLHHQLKVPAELIEKVIGANAATMNGYSLPLNILIIAKGWPKEQPKLDVPVLYSGSATVILNLMCALADVAEWQRFKKARKDYQAIIDGTSAFLFSLRTVIAAYVYVASGFGKNENEIDSSDTTFLYLVAGSAVPALVSTIYNVRNNHVSIENKFLRGLGIAVNTFTAGALIHDSIDTVYPSNNSTYPIQLAYYGVSVALGLMLSIGSTYSAKSAKLIEIIAAVNIINTLIEVYENLDLDADVTEEERLGLASIFITTVTMAISLTIGITCYKHYSENHEQSNDETQMVESKPRIVELVDSSETDSDTLDIEDPSSEEEVEPIELDEESTAKVQEKSIEANNKIIRQFRLFDLKFAKPSSFAGDLHTHTETKRNDR